MTRYAVKRNERSMLRPDECLDGELADGYVMMVNYSSIAVHDAQLMAQVWEEAARITREGAEALRHVGAYEKAEALFQLSFQFDAKAAALRQRGVE